MHLKVFMTHRRITHAAKILAENLMSFSNNREVSKNTIGTFLHQALWVTNYKGSFYCNNFP